MSYRKTVPLYLKDSNGYNGGAKCSFIGTPFDSV